jgi:class 3 adenylate cyclase/tetratricopeptide (TPR) repeat protein
MQCLSCNALNPESHRFCEECGSALMRRCPACGHSGSPGARFCGNCGSALGHAVTVPPVKPPPANLGELKVATILFADIVASTEQIASLDPEQAMDQLQPAVLQMCEAVTRFGGTVVRTLGDGIMAVFGVPKALEGHARLGCEAALAIKAAFERHPLALRVRVGLHSGQVASDPNATDSSIGGGVHGQAIHLASRVVAQAEPGSIYLTTACLALVRPACQSNAVGWRYLKGIPQPVALHALVHIDRQTGDGAFHVPVRSGFRGRQAEMSDLQAALVRADSGLGSAIGVSGPPGTGKSRLVHEFCQWCLAQGVVTREIKTQLYGRSTPLAPVLDLLRTVYFGLPQMQAPGDLKQAVTDRLAEVGEATEENVAVVCELLGIDEAAAQSPVLSPKARKSRLMAVLRKLASRESEASAVIVFEDLHWLDEASEEYLHVLVESVARSRTLLILNYRPEYQPPWAGQPHFQKLDLRPLEHADIAAIASELLEPRPALRAAVAQIVERASGNPFFAEELVHALIEAQTDSDAPDYLDQVVRALPPTVEAVIAERIDRLVETQKSLLQMCAVIGKEIPLAVLQQVAVYLAHQLEWGLDGLCEAEMLELLREIAGGRRFAFRHPLIQEVAYGTQLKARRAELHGAVAVAMEQHYHAQPDEFAALIAFHYEAAGQLEQAARYQARAASWLGATNSTQAMAHWRKARALLTDQPRTPDLDRLRVAIGSGFVYLGWREGLGPEELRSVVSETVELATAVDGRLVQLVMLADARIQFGNGGAADAYVQGIREAIELTPESMDLGRLGTLNAALSHALAWAGLLHEALEANDMALHAAASVDRLDREFMGFDVRQWVLAIRIRMLVRMKRLREAAQCLVLLSESVKPADDPVMRLVALGCGVELHCATGEVALANGYAEALIKLARTHPSPYLNANAGYFGGLAKLAEGDFVQARAAFRTCLDLIQSTRVCLDFEAEALIAMAESHLEVEEWAAARDCAVRALAVARDRFNRVAECRSLIVLGAVGLHSQTGKAREAGLADLALAQRLLTETGAHLFEAALESAQALVGAVRSPAA